MAIITDKCFLFVRGNYFTDEAQSLFFFVFINLQVIFWVCGGEREGGVGEEDEAIRFNDAIRM